MLALGGKKAKAKKGHPTKPIPIPDFPQNEILIYLSAPFLLLLNQLSFCWELYLITESSSSK